MSCASGTLSKNWQVTQRGGGFPPWSEPVQWAVDLQWGGKASGSPENGCNEDHGQDDEV